LDLNNGWLLFFKNGAKHGPGYAAGGVTGPVVAATQSVVATRPKQFGFVLALRLPQATRRQSNDDCKT
jgi:hypothetical protein